MPNFFLYFVEFGQSIYLVILMKICLNTVGADKNLSHFFIMEGMMDIELKEIEQGIIPIYENETKERLINARELHSELKNKRKFADWIKQRIEHYKFLENQDFFRFHNFVKGDEKGFGNKDTMRIGTRF